MLNSEKIVRLTKTNKLLAWHGIRLHVSLKFKTILISDETQPLGNNLLSWNKSEKKYKKKKLVPPPLPLKKEKMLSMLLVWLNKVTNNNTNKNNNELKDFT